MTTRGTTVPERFAALGFDPENRLSWAAGSAVRDTWVKLTRRRPALELRKKTRGHGSHCLAVYPARFAPIIDATILAVVSGSDPAQAAQGELFQ